MYMYNMYGPRVGNKQKIQYFRYFNCRPLYGLFAPVSKVVKDSSPSQISSPSLATPRRQPPGTPRVGTIGRPTGANVSRDRSGSQDSISSIGSNTSSVSRSRVRLGITALTTQVQ